MRVVAGTARGRKLAAPAGTATRPTSDRVREALFNALFSLGDVIDDASVHDAFAGSGALGIEAISRGARQVTFIERDPHALRVLEQNLRATGTEARARVVRADAPSWLARTEHRFDVALCDPPYGFDGWDDLLAGMPARIVVIESDREVAVGDEWDVLRSRRYGGTVVTIVRRRAPA
jgi:16S rRNA (guanine966-N2)-methyltransferase